MVLPFLICPIAALPKAHAGDPYDVNELKMIDAKDFTVSAETDKKVYNQNQPIKIFAKITNNKSNQWIIIHRLLCDYEIRKVVEWGEPSFSKSGTVKLDRPGDWKAAVGRNSTRLHWITNYDPQSAVAGGGQLKPGLYEVRITFVDPDYSDYHICGGNKLIRIRAKK